MLKDYILDRLRGITAEEQMILDGSSNINNDLYMQDQNDVINSHKLLAAGKLITLRPHTRFIDFPMHSHDYVEILYICAGELRQTVNGDSIVMKPGELMLLGQNAKHSIKKCGSDDIAVNIIVLPEFFTVTLSLMGSEGEFTLLHHFLQDCLLEKNKGPGYLYFKVSDNDKIQNLMENLIITLLYKSNGRQKISQLLMTILFMELPNATEQLKWSQEERSILHVLSYIDNHYTNGSLGEVAQSLHYDVSTLSRKIHEQTGKTYTQLMQEKRMAQAAFLLRNTDSLVDDISLAVGYENISYFHQLFRKYYGISPRQYRMSK